MNCGTDLGNAPWLVGPLKVLSVVEPQAFIVGRAFFSLFFASCFGPRLEAACIDVLAPSDTVDLVQRLRIAAPKFRWQVSLVEDPAAELALRPLVAGCAGLHIADGQPEVVTGHPLALSHLDSGLLAPRLSRNAAMAAARPLLALYPGLRAPFLDYAGEVTDDSVDRIRHAVETGERGGRRDKVEIDSNEYPWLAAIQHWHEHNQSRALTVPMPPRADLPDGNPWLAPDANFREWLLHQTLLRNGSPDDAFLRRALASQSGAQKPTHQGLETYLHAIIAALQIETDWAPSQRKALRVAILLHDIGKTFNVWTPGAHPFIGAKIWRRLRPDWLDDEEANLVSLLIRCHDLLGRLDRALTQPEFRGGVSPAQARQELLRSRLRLESTLSLASAIYRADIASVATLRWLLPLTPLLEAMVLATPAAIAPSLVTSPA